MFLINHPILYTITLLTVCLTIILVVLQAIIILLLGLFYKFGKLTHPENQEANNQIEWVQLMNNYKNMAEEIILRELIYV